MDDKTLLEVKSEGSSSTIFFNNIRGLNGWWRLWLLLSSIWISSVSIYGFYYWPSGYQYSSGESLVNSLSSEQKKLLVLNGIDPIGLNVEMPDGYVLRFRLGVDESVALPIARAYHGIVERTQREVRYRHVMKFFMIAVVPCGLFALLGVGVAWVYKGFKMTPRVKIKRSKKRGG